VTALAWPLVVLVLGIGALRLASRSVRLSEQHRRERRQWARETETLREAVESVAGRAKALEEWRIVLKNRNNGRD
jgi:hypothetical protein